MLDFLMFFIALAVVISLIYGVVSHIRVKHKFDNYKPVKSNLKPSNQTNISDFNKYRIKESLMTNTEIKFYNCIKFILKDRYILLPQINLATVLQKVSGSSYQTELYRNIDFGIFNKNFKTLLLIEINDDTHKTKSRVERDKKVADICFNAGLPLIRFWTSYGVNYQYINSRVRQYLDLN